MIELQTILWDEFYKQLFEFSKKRNEFCTCFIQFKDAGSLQPVLSKTIHIETLCQKQLLRENNKRQITFLITKEVAT